ncbi:hypothetical protein [Lysobacter gummosus]|uniref:hypothetical protein n=1 Tax=Lysobacter gummosus TaxID=262324 RepID=UPI0036289D76
MRWCRVVGAIIVSPKHRPAKWTRNGANRIDAVVGQQIGDVQSLCTANFEPPAGNAPLC